MIDWKRLERERIAAEHEREMRELSERTRLQRLAAGSPLGFNTPAINARTALAMREPPDRDRADR